jgi:hypothetical protein
MNRRAFLSLPAAALAPSKSYSFLWDNPFAAGALTARRWNQVVLEKLKQWEREGFLTPREPIIRSRMEGKRIITEFEVFPPFSPELLPLLRQGSP